MDYIVIVKAWNGTFYLTPNLEFEDSLGDNVLWNSKEWDEKTIENYIKDDAKIHNYTYIIESLGD